MPNTALSSRQSDLFTSEQAAYAGGAMFKTQLLKWIGNKQRQAPEIVKSFPVGFRTYYEPFLGSGGVLGVLAPRSGVAGDAFAPLVEIWATLNKRPHRLKEWYAERHALIQSIGKEAAYASVLESYNRSPNGADLLFLCRTCYGGVVRFRKADGYMSTPCGVHDPISPDSFDQRVDVWAERTQGTRFIHSDFAETMALAKAGDLVYCDPPYADSQTILYGAQEFSLPRLFDAIAACKSRGVFVALSIDGSKFSGAKVCELPIPSGLFEQERFINIGRSMLKRFQMDGRTLERHIVSDRLLLTY
jgi:DNA adenine methylase